MVTTDYVYYTAGYKYQTKEDFTIQAGIYPEQDIVTDYISLTCDGIIFIKKGYAWDGPSGPTVDTNTFMRGSLVHDALYQLMREGHLPKSARAKADRLLKRMCKKDGMWKIRASWVHFAVKYFAKGAADKKNKKDILKAP